MSAMNLPKGLPKHAVSPVVLDQTLSSPIAGAAGKWGTATREAKQLFNLTGTWGERLGMARFLTELYLARALPIDTYGWDASIRLGGTHYTVGLRSSEIYVFEELLHYRLYDRIEHYIPERDWVVFDLGANVGMVSMLEAKRGADVYAFEPNPDCFRRLLKNVLANGLEGRIHAFNIAVGAAVGAGTMHVDKGGTTGGTVTVGAAPGQARRVGITTLDQISAAIGVSQIDLLKIDIEGAEVDALRGATRTLSMTARVIIEYHSAALLSETEAILERHGLVTEQRLVYVPEVPERGQEEVGILYARRS
jgi:FkbM family methyltransferase